MPSARRRIGAMRYADIEASHTDAAVHRHRRVRSRAGRRHRPRLAGAARRRARHRQVHAAAAGGGATSRSTVGPVLYASGEESEHQIKSRGDRLGVGDAPLYLLAETCIERILEEVGRVKPTLLVVDSVQTVFSLKFQSAPGSIGQVREAATQFLFTAKGHNIPTFLVGHVTKDGNLAGPKALEHVVDTVLYFEGERHHSHRVVRAVKNRFGAISELGVFEMTGAGLRAGAQSLGAVPRRAAARPRRVRPCCAASRARGRSWWRCRRSSAPPATAWRAAWRSGSIRTGCRCCWPCSRSAPACTWSATMCSSTSPAA